MSVQYKKAMDQIVVSDELRQKVLDKTATILRRPIWIKPALSVAACFAFVVIGTVAYLNRDGFSMSKSNDLADGAVQYSAGAASTSGGGTSSTAASSSASSIALDEAVPEMEDGAAAQKSVPGADTNMMLVNPVVSYETLEEAVAVLPFAPILPQKLPEGVTMDGCAVIDGTLLEIRYLHNGNEILYRTAAEESGVTDISGNYNTYDTTTIENYLQIPVTCKGNGDTISLATWSTIGQQFSVYSEKALPKTEVEQLLKSLME